jgi:hypothetical protein
MFATPAIGVGMFSLAHTVHALTRGNGCVRHE